MSAVEAQPDLARQLVRIMRLALEEIAAHQCLDRTPEGDTCAEGDECAVCLEERAESRRREADEREKRARFAALGTITLPAPIGIIGDPPAGVLP